MLVLLPLALLLSVALPTGSTDVSFVITPAPVTTVVFDAQLQDWVVSTA